MKVINLYNILICFIISAIFILPARAAVFYLPSEYNAIYNEKVALEIELKTVKRAFTNEKANYESRIKALENTIEDLKNELSLSEKSREEDKKAYETKIKELENVRNILQAKGSEREKELLESNKNLQKKYQEENERLRSDLQKERESKIAELAKQKAEYEKRISDLESRLASISNDLSEIKKLSESQKKELDRMSLQAGELEKQLEEEIKKGDIRLKREHQRLIIDIGEKISFDSGQADLKKTIMSALDKIAQILSNYPENNIQVEGHTDNVPISTKRFRDNWQLSTERSLAVLNYLLRNTGLNPVRFTASGFGEYRPVVSNDTPENKALNRRVEIVVVPRIVQK